MTHLASVAGPARAEAAVLVGLGAGSVLGLVVFGGIRLTVARLVQTRIPALLVLGSMIVRLGIVGGAMLALARLHPTALAAGVGGMLLVRAAFLRTARAGAGTATGGER